MPKGGIGSNDYIVTEATRLREILSRAEMLAHRLKGRDGHAVLRLLKLRDALETEFSEREEMGMDLGPERTRLETIDNILHTRAPVVVRALREAGGIEHYREEIGAPESHWWWYVDREVRENRRRSLIRTSTIVAIVLVVVLGGNALLDHFYGLSDQEKAAREFTNVAEQAMMEMDYDAAIVQYEAARDIMPELADVQASLGALYEVSGREEESDEAFASLRSLCPDEITYEMQLAQAYQQVGELEFAVLHADNAVRIDGANAEAIFLRGSMHESLGNVDQAIDDFTLASELAIDQDEDALYVLAKTRLGMLMQGGSGIGGAFGF